MARAASDSLVIIAPVTGRVIGRKTARSSILNHPRNFAPRNCICLNPSISSGHASAIVNSGGRGDMRSFVLSRARAASYPGVLAEIVQMIGEEATTQLIAQHGGTSIYIPNTLKPGHPLSGLIGQESAQRLAHEFGGLTIEIPLAVMLQKEQRNKAIHADQAAGMSQSQLARKYRLSTRHIRTITRRT